jgi:hypothetical protein
MSDRSDRWFGLVDFAHMNRAGYLRLYEAGHTHALPRAIAHAATKRMRGEDYDDRTYCLTR